jgi:nucleotide-binding universal stress UspA family protein
MPIFCVTNLSLDSMRAASAAAALAVRLREPLVLYGVAEEESQAPEVSRTVLPWSERLEAEAQRLRGLGVEVRVAAFSAPGEVLLSDEECRQARWLMLAAEGWQAPLWRRTPLPERLVRRACAPVLVVRREEALADWARGRRRLLALVGVDISSELYGFEPFLRALREVGPCDIIATYVCSPAEERERLGVHTPVRVEQLDPVVRGIQALDPLVESVLLREVRERVGEVPGEGKVEIHLEPGYGRRADHLLHVAHERGVDLMVVGTHQRAGLQRWWHGSVSQGVLRHAGQSVVCVPAMSVRPPRPSPPRRVLVPVDFSEASLRALAQARMLMAAGGHIHLLYVHVRRLGDPDWTDYYGVLPVPPSEREEVLRRLQALVSQEEGGVSWSVEAVSASEVPLAICQAAEREGVDLVCVGAREGPLGRVGGAARQLMARCQRPVLVVPAAAEARGLPGWGPPGVHGQ